MRPGTKPKATRLRIIEGNPSREPLNPWEPQPPVLADEAPPAELQSPRAIEEWRRLVPMLRNLRVATEADQAALIALCQQWALYLEASEKVAQAGLVVKTAAGAPMANPYIGIASKALAHCTRLWAELGCTPSARSRVIAKSDEGQSQRKHGSQNKWAGLL